MTLQELFTLMDNIHQRMHGVSRESVFQYLADKRMFLSSTIVVTAWLAYTNMDFYGRFAKLQTSQTKLHKVIQAVSEKKCNSTIIYNRIKLKNWRRCNVYFYNLSSV